MATADEQRIAELEERLAGLYDQLDQATAPEFVQPDTGGPRGKRLTKKEWMAEADRLYALAEEARRKGDHRLALKYQIEATHCDPSKVMVQKRR